MQQQAVMRKLDWSASKIHRIEHGPSRVQTGDLMALLQLYGVQDPEEISRLTELARQSRLPGISTRYKSSLDPEFVEYLDYEAFADHLVSYQTKFIPGVLQLGGYADAVNRLRADSEEQVDRRTDARNERAQYLLGSDGPPLEFIIDEAALHRAIGSTDKPWREKYGVMKRVVRNLRDLNTQVKSPDDVAALINPRISIQIVPLEWDMYESYVGPFVILDFDDPSDQSLLMLEYPTSQQLVFDSDLVEKRREEFENLKASIPPPSETDALLSFIDQEYDRRLELSPLRPYRIK